MALQHTLLVKQRALLVEQRACPLVLLLLGMKGGRMGWRRD